MKQAEIDHLLAGMKPVRPLASEGVYVGGLAVAAAVGIAGGVWILGLGGWRALSNADRVLLLMPLVASCFLLMLSLVRQMSPGRRLVRAPGWGPVLAVGAVGLVVMLLFPARHEPFFAGAHCLRRGLVCALCVAALQGAVTWRGAMLSPALAGFTAGALAGLAGMTMLQLECPDLNMLHIAMWHLTVPVLLAGIGPLLYIVLRR